MDNDFTNDDIEKKRQMLAKELGLSYSDRSDPNFWQRNKQTEEAMNELLKLEQERTERDRREQAEHNSINAGQQGGRIESDKHRRRNRHAADESGYASYDAPDPIFEQGQTDASYDDAAATTAMRSGAGKLPLSLRIRSLLHSIRNFAQTRRQRSQATGVAAQKAEKRRQWKVTAAVVALLFVGVGVAVWIGNAKPVRTHEANKVYRSDFRLEPDALDKQSYQKQYDERLQTVDDRLRTMEELAKRLEREIARKDAEQRKRTEAENAPKNSVPVNALPPFENDRLRAGTEANLLDSAIQAPAKAVGLAPQGPVLQRLMVADPKEDREAIRSAAVKRYAARRALADSPIAANRAKHEAAGTYLPAGSFARAVVLAGATVSTGGTASSNPIPMLLEIKDFARLPNAFRANVKACFATANATGDLSSERIWIRLERLSCMTHAGKAFDAKIQGYATGDDGKTGVRARLVTRSGQAIASALLTGSISGLGRAVSLGAQNTVTYSSGASGTTVTDSLRAGLGEGLESALDRIADYYIRLADKIFPCLELDSGRKVDLILSQGLTIDIGDPEPEPSGAAQPLPSEGGEINNSERFGDAMQAHAARYE